MRLPPSVRNNLIALVALWCSFPMLSAYIERGVVTALMMVVFYAPAPVLLCVGFLWGSRITRWRIRNVGLLLFVCFIWGMIAMCCSWIYGFGYGISWAKNVTINPDPVAAGIASAFFWAFWTGALGWITGVILAAQHYSRIERRGGLIDRFFEYKTNELVNGVVSTVCQIPYAVGLAAVLLILSRVIPADAALVAGLVVGVASGYVLGLIMDQVVKRLLGDENKSSQAPVNPHPPSSSPFSKWLDIALRLVDLGLLLFQCAVIGLFIARIFTHLPTGVVKLPINFWLAKEAVIFDPNGPTAKRFGTDIALILGTGFYVGIFGAVANMARQALERIIHLVLLAIGRSSQ